MSEYKAPESMNEVSKRWYTGPHPYLSALTEVVTEALDQGITNTQQMKDYAAQRLNVTDAERAIASQKVEGGAFGMDVFYARDHVEAKRRAQENERCRESLMLT